MKRLAVLAVVVAAVAWASELRVATVQGANIRTFTGAAGGKYSIQCPSVDGGTGQKVYMRPGCPTRTDAGVTCVVDAGSGDVIVDFSSNLDPYKIDLAPNEDRFHLATVGSYAVPVWCTVYRRSPP